MMLLLLLLPVPILPELIGMAPHDPPRCINFLRLGSSAKPGLSLMSVTNPTPGISLWVLTRPTTEHG
jgi:hypothetical protein